MLKSIFSAEQTELSHALTRRSFFGNASMGLGTVALAHLLKQDRLLANNNPSNRYTGILKKPHFPPKTKRVIYLFMSGGPSQLELFDYKPILNEKQGQELPDSVRKGQRLTGMSGNQATLPLAGSIFKFARRGKSGTWVSELLPHTSKVIDDLCVIKSMNTQAINHDPAITFFQTGFQIAGRPSMGSWLSYGLGSGNENLPSFCVMITKNKGGQPLYARLWGSGFLPTMHQGVQFRAGKDPVLYLNNPIGTTTASRRKLLDKLAELHLQEYQRTIDPAVEARIEQYEMAYRMQSSIPEVTNFASEPKHILDLYGSDVNKPGSFAANCLLARRLAERNVRFIQLFHQGWDQHGNLPGGIKNQCHETD